jgi:hypothetical protein
MDAVRYVAVSPEHYVLTTAMLLMLCAVFCVLNVTGR